MDLTMLTEEQREAVLTMTGEEILQIVALYEILHVQLPESVIEGWQSHLPFRYQFTLQNYQRAKNQLNLTEAKKVAKILRKRAKNAEGSS